MEQSKDLSPKCPLLWKFKTEKWGSLVVTVKPQSSTIHQKNKISRGGGKLICNNQSWHQYFQLLSWYSTFLLKFLSTILKDYFHSHLTTYPCHHSKSRNKWKPRKNLEKNIFRTMESAILIKIDVPQRRRLANDLSDRLSPPSPPPTLTPKTPFHPDGRLKGFLKYKYIVKQKLFSSLRLPVWPPHDSC